MQLAAYIEHWVQRVLLPQVPQVPPNGEVVPYPTEQALHLETSELHTKQAGWEHAIHVPEEETPYPVPQDLHLIMLYVQIIQCGSVHGAHILELTP